MNKQTIMRDLARVLTDPRLRDIDLDGYLQGLTGDALLSGSYRVMAAMATAAVLTSMASLLLVIPTSPVLDTI
jgi:hypothetical protein